MYITNTVFSRKMINYCLFGGNNVLAIFTLKHSHKALSHLAAPHIFSSSRRQLSMAVYI